MSKIQLFGTKTRLKNNESLSFGREIEAIVLEKGASALDIVSLFGQYQTSLQDFDDSIVKQSKSGLTAEKQAADAQRDNVHVGIIEQINTATRHFVKETKDAGIRLKVMADMYQGGQNRTFDDQTGFEYNFIQALTSDTHKADVTLLGLDPWVAELKKANDLCASLTTQRSKEKSNQAPKGSAEETRPIYEHAYDAMVERLNALALVNGDEKYNELMGWWNAIIDHYRVVISNNLGAGKGGQTGGGSSKPTTKPEEPGGMDRPDEI